MHFASSKPLISFKSSLSPVTCLWCCMLVNANGIFYCLSLQLLYSFLPVHCSTLIHSTSQYLTSWDHNSHATTISSDASKSLMHPFIAQSCLRVKTCPVLLQVLSADTTAGQSDSLDQQFVSRISPATWNSFQDKDKKSDSLMTFKKA